MSKQMTEYQKNLVRMWDSLRTKDKGTSNCYTVQCKQCPFNAVVCNTNNCSFVSFNAEKAIEIVNDWAKEHPIVTMADKYKEVFGFEPKTECGAFICPHFVGFAYVECVNGEIYKDCKKCKNEFWNSEYKEPKKEGEV